MTVAEQPSIWGLTPAQLHDRFWASRGVQVVRRGEPSEIVPRADLFLLTDPRSVVLFDLLRLIDVLCWTKPQVLYVRLQDRRERGYRERVLVSSENRFVGFQRIYGASDSRLARVVLTGDRDLAHAWQSAANSREGWRELRSAVPRKRRHVMSVAGSVYDRNSDQELVEFSRRLVQVWRRPDATIGRAVRSNAMVWTDVEASVSRSVTFVGPVWIGAGRTIDGNSSVVGPSILWDDPVSRPQVEHLQWDKIEPSEMFDGPVHARPVSSFNRAMKRMFDVAFAIVALAMTFPLFPFVMIAIWLEDGRPFFFAHQRETLGGREFPCIKFRSMRKDAEKIKQELTRHNQADGPQFFMENDPRLTRVGRIIRKFNVDEIPQFLNVLAGDMSIVGPRPSPHRENQYCPPWREARLSVRPGVTGLWQVMRTRSSGADFQEWIKYDIEYVESASWGLDLWIIWRTLALMAGHRLLAAARPDTADSDFSSQATNGERIPAPR